MLVKRNLAHDHCSKFLEFSKIIAIFCSLQFEVSALEPTIELSDVQVYKRCYMRPVRQPTTVTDPILQQVSAGTVPLCRKACANSGK